MRKALIAAATVIAAAVLAVVGILLPAAASAAAPPRVIQMNYYVYGEGPSPHASLVADIRRADSVGFSTVFKGKHASAPGRFDDGTRSCHCWEVRRHHSRGSAKVYKLYKLIRRSLRRRGSASVRIRARNGSGVDRVKFKIRVSDCEKDPPLWLLNCEIPR